MEEILAGNTYLLGHTYISQLTKTDGVVSLINVRIIFVHHAFIRRSIPMSEYLQEQNQIKKQILQAIIPQLFALPYHVDQFQSRVRMPLYPAFSQD